MCVVQYGRRSVVAGEIKGFSRMWELNLSSLMVYFKCFVLKQLG